MRKAWTHTHMQAQRLQIPFIKTHPPCTVSNILFTVFTAAVRAEALGLQAGALSEATCAKRRASSGCHCLRQTLLWEQIFLSQEGTARSH